jgi:hypothetical protein
MSTKNNSNSITPEKEKDSQSDLRRKKWGWFGLIPHAIGFPSCVFILQFLLKTDIITQCLNIDIPKVWDFENKILYVFKLWTWIGLYFMINVVCVILGRMSFAIPNPLAGKDHEIIVLLNRVLTHSLEQAAIFVPMLAYWTLKYADETNKWQAASLTVIWIFSRIIFALGYYLGLLVNMTTMRVPGFLLTFGTSFILALRIMNCHVL